MTHENIVEATATTLASKPFLSGGVATSTSIIGIMNILTPYIEFTTLILGFMIATLTVYGLVRKHFLKNGKD